MARHPSTPADSAELMEWIRLAAQGDTQAKCRLAEMLCNELRSLAVAKMKQERVDHTLEPAALVNEALLRLLKPTQLAALETRRMFYAAASRAMGQVLIDHARKKQRSIEGLRTRAGSAALDQLEQSGLRAEYLSDALEALEQYDANLSELVRLRFFLGMTLNETAEMLETTPAVVKGGLAKAKRFLREKLTR